MSEREMTYCPDCGVPEGERHMDDCRLRPIERKRSSCILCDMGIAHSHASLRKPVEKTKVPFEVQKFLFDTLAPNNLEDLLHHLLCKYEQRIMKMARIRMAEGYTEYGDEMFCWGKDQRLTEILEELADALVYTTSGELP